MDEDYRMVDFDTYCKICRYCDKDALEDPCYDCLDEPINQFTDRPVNYTEAK